MANRWGNQFTHSLVKDTWKLYAKCVYGSSGAVTLQAVPYKDGIVSVTKESTAGQYTFVFGTQAGMLDVWPYFMNATCVFEHSSAPAAPIMYVLDNSTNEAGVCSMTIQLLDFAGAAANPGSGEIGYFEFTFSNSTAP